MLTTANYSTWEFKIEIFLIKEDLFHVITEDQPNPMTGDWSKSDKNVRALINLTIHDSQIMHVKNL